MHVPIKRVRPLTTSAQNELIVYLLKMLWNSFVDIIETWFQNPTVQNESLTCLIQSRTIITIIFSTTKYVGMKLLTSFILTLIYDIKTLHNNTLFSMFVAFPQIIRMTLVMRGPCLKRCTLIRTRTAYPCLRCG